MARIKFYRQRPIKGGREALPACVLKSIYVEVDKQAKKHHVSRSFVIATVLAHAFGVSDQEDYHTAAERATNPPPPVDTSAPGPLLDTPMQGAQRHEVPETLPKPRRWGPAQT